MSVAVAPALPQELVARLEDAERVVPHHPGLVLFRQHELRASGGSVHEVDIELILVAIEHFEIDDILVYPSNPGNVVVALVLLARETGNVYPVCPAAVGIDHPYPYFGIGISRVGILLMIDRWMIRDVVGDRILGDLR